MGFLTRLFGAGGPKDDAGDPEGIHFYVRCDKCGEKLHIRANRRTDVTQEYQEDSDRATPTLHKEILGSRCQNLMYVHLTLDGAYKIIGSQTERCTLITRQEYEAPDS